MRAALLAAGGPGTELDFIPTGVAQAWRIVFLAGGSIVLGQFVGEYRGRFHALPPWARWGQGALVVLIVRALVVQIERFDSPILLEGLVVNTVAVGLLAVGILHSHRARRRIRRDPR